MFLLFGATGELGKAAVEFFLNQNYDQYYFFTRNNFELQTVKNNYSIISVSDLTKEEYVTEAFAKVKKRNDAGYYLFSTVGGFIGGDTIATTGYADFKKMLDINLCSSFLIAKHFAKLVEGTEGGSICFTSALSSFKPEANKAAYNISKNALNYLVETLALEGKGIRLRANAIAPFAIDTQANREWLKNTSKLVRPKDICQVAQSFFDNNTASGQIIGLP